MSGGHWRKSKMAKDSFIKKQLKKMPIYKAAKEVRAVVRLVKGKIKETEVPANAMAGSSSTQGPIRTFDPLLRAKKAKKLLRRQTDASRHNKTPR